VFEQGSSRKALVIDLSSSSDEEYLIVDTSRDEEFARMLFGDLNRVVLGPSSNDKIIILSHSDEEEKEACEEKIVGTEPVATSTAVNPTSTASTVDTDEALEGLQDDNGGEGTPKWDAGDGSTGGDKTGLP
jgi:hypothetical protein